MAYARAIRFVTLFLLAFWLVPTLATGPKPADQVFRLGVTLGEDDELALSWSIEPGYYLYRDRLAATLRGKTLRLTTAPAIGLPSALVTRPLRDALPAVGMPAELMVHGEKVVTPVASIQLFVVGSALVGLTTFNITGAECMVGPDCASMLTV